MHTPDQLADARSIVLSPEIAALVPSATYDAWARLKAARGQPIARPEILARQHLITAPAGPCGTLDFIDQTRARIIPRIQARVRQIQMLRDLHGEPDGAA